MKCGEAQRAEHLTFDSEESPNICEFSVNSHSAVNVEDSTHFTDHDHEDHMGLPKGESKWGKFLEINSSEDNGKLLRFLRQYLNYMMTFFFNS